MNYTISPDRRTLTIRADDEERKYLRDNFADKPNKNGADVKSIHADSTMHEVLEHLVCNSELQWIHPGETGDWTDAPMLGIYANESTLTNPILERWAFMDYQVRSPLEDLRDKGEAVFIS